MTQKQFNTKKEKLYNNFGALETQESHEVYIDTKYGRMYISADYTPRIKVASLHSKLNTNDVSLENFKTETGYDINTYNGKCNFYSEDPDWILDTLEEYLDNLKYLT